MDLDDLLDESGNALSPHIRKQAMNGGGTGGMSKAATIKNVGFDDDEWGDTEIKPKENPAFSKAKSQKVEESKQVEIEDEWGDMEFNEKQDGSVTMQPKEDKEAEDDWGIITPAPPKKKKVEEIGVKSRKQEDPDEDDEWGDTTSSKFKLKSDTVSYYEASTTEPKLMKRTDPVPNGTKCFPLCIGGADLNNGLTEDS